MTDELNGFGRKRTLPNRGIRSVLRGAEENHEEPVLTRFRLSTSRIRVGRYRYVSLLGGITCVRGLND
jgi:hypothetical protein